LITTFSYDKFIIIYTMRKKSCILKESIT
jgi:hypothetical protein